MDVTISIQCFECNRTLFTTNRKTIYVEIKIECESCGCVNDIVLQTINDINIKTRKGR